MRASSGRSALAPAAFTVMAVLLLVLGSPSAFGRLTAGITNNANSAISNPYYLCASAAQASGKNAYFAYPFNETSGTSPADTSGNGRTGTYSSTGLTYRTTGGPCKRDTTGYAVTFNGSSGYATGPTSATIAGPNVFSVEIWFRTAVAGGKLIGFGDAVSGASANYDRHLYVTSNGKVAFGVYPNGVKTIVSTATVTDNKWHHAVGTLSTAGMALYLDGAQVGTTDTTVTSAQSFSGYWRIGYDNLSGWTNAPTNAYFTGDLAWPEVYSYALTAEQAKSHYLAGT